MSNTKESGYRIPLLLLVFGLVISRDVTINNRNSKYYPTDKPSYYSSDNHIVLVPKDETIYICANDKKVSSYYDLYRHNLTTDSDNDGYYDYEFIEGDENCIKIDTTNTTDLELADQMLKKAGQQPLQRTRIKYENEIDYYKDYGFLFF